MTKENCEFFEAKGMHLHVPYFVKATGKIGECCYGCGLEKND